MTGRMSEPTRVVSAADGHVLGHLVKDLNGHLLRAWDAELVGQRLVSQPELAVLALDAANRLASVALSLGPLRLLVASGASVRAESALGAASAVGALARNHSLNVAVAARHHLALLDARPATELEPGEVDRAVLVREVGARQFAVREVLVQAAARQGARGA